VSIANCHSFRKTTLPPLHLDSSWVNAYHSVFPKLPNEEQRMCELRASPIILYRKPESGKRWKDVNCGSSRHGKSLYSSFIYRLKHGFGRFFRGACNRFWNVLLRQVWENDVLMIIGLQAYRTTGVSRRTRPRGR
jgi:hypothetical protein